MLKIYSFKTVTSTNEKAKEFFKKGVSRFAILAETQTKGRGRFNRHWLSDLGGLYMTLAFKEGNLDAVRYLTLIASISTAESIKKISGLTAEVKWPNDVLLNNKKICGVLTETFSKEKRALVGIGINVNQKKFPKGIARKSTSLKIETHKSYSIRELSKIIIKNFELHYNYYKNKNYKKILAVWKRYSHTIGKKVKVITLSGVYTGEAFDIDSNCNLMLRLNNGRIKRINEGDISVV
ncbi:biotin--[acetyl-CoA-carboxylase] ligase [Candidatus Woesearchaeota archaeon]|nr:biotin--[acetyl-CoA-carboxylase] ligase [Candidatus Woesearchaeota archaeon]